MAHCYQRSKSAPMGYLFQALQHPVQTLDGLEEESVLLLMQEVSSGSDPNSSEQYQRHSQANPADQQDLNAGYCTNAAIKRRDEPDADELLLTLTNNVALLKKNVHGCEEQESSTKDASTKHKSTAENVNSQSNTAHLPNQLYVFQNGDSPAVLTTDRQPEHTPYLPELAANQFQAVLQEPHSSPPENPRESEVNDALLKSNQLAAHDATGAGGPEEQNPNRREDTGPESNRNGPPHVTLQIQPTDQSTAPIRKQRVLAWLASHKGVICCVVLIAFFLGLGYFVGRHSVHPSNALGVTCHCDSANARAKYAFECY